MCASSLEIILLIGWYSSAVEFSGNQVVSRSYGVIEVTRHDSCAAFSCSLSHTQYTLQLIARSVDIECCINDDSRVTSHISITILLIICLIYCALICASLRWGRLWKWQIQFSTYVVLFDMNNPPLTTPLTSTWPYLNSDVGLEEGKY